MVQAIAEKYKPQVFHLPVDMKRYDIGGFADELARTFVGAENHSPLAMRQAAEQAPPIDFTSSGFQSQFADPNNGNQVRHYVGGLIAGLDWGAGMGLRYMNSRETPGHSDYASDTALNAVSTRHGGSLTNRTDPRVLPDLIRRDVCAH